MAALSGKSIIGLAVTAGLVGGGFYLYKKLNKDGCITNIVDTITNIPNVIVNKTEELVKSTPLLEAKKEVWDNVTDGDITTKDVTDLILNTSPAVAVAEALGADDAVNSTSQAVADFWDSKTAHADAAVEEWTAGNTGAAVTAALKVTAAEPIVIAAEETVKGADKLASDWSSGNVGAVASDLWNATPAGQVASFIGGLFGH